MRKSASAIFMMLFLLATLAFSAETERVGYKRLLQLNVANIGKISLGMTFQEVEEIMGKYTSAVKDGALSNPWRKDLEGETTVYHYLTRRHPPFTTILESQAVPVIFSGGKVVGIGRQYLRSLRESIDNPPTAGADTSESGIEERLKRLKTLYDSGAIDSVTYKAQQKRILDRL